MKTTKETLNKLKIITNIILILTLLVCLAFTLLYKQEVKEALQFEEPNRLIKIFEEKTNTNCLCANKEYGYVVFVPIEQES